MNKKRRKIFDVLLNIFVFLTIAALVFTVAIYISVCRLETNMDFETVVAAKKFDKIATEISEDNQKAVQDIDYNILAALTGKSEDERVLYAIRTGNTLTLNERECNLYRVASDFAEKTEGSDELTVVKEAHDYICNTLQYARYAVDYAVPNDDSQSSFGALVLKNTALCGGYARGFNLLCNAAGVEAIYITGFASDTSHAWSMVRLDGNYYHVDCCWDDSGDEPQYNYFLLSDDEMLLSRFWEGGLYPSCDKVFNFKEESA